MTPGDSMTFGTAAGLVAYDDATFDDVDPAVVAACDGE